MTLDFYKIQTKVEQHTKDNNTCYNDKVQDLKGLVYKDYLCLLRSLPDVLRFVFNLYAIDEYSHEEIGRILNSDKAKSRELVRQSREKIKHYLQSEPLSICN